MLVRQGDHCDLLAAITAMKKREAARAEVPDEDEWWDIDGDDESGSGDDE